MMIGEHHPHHHPHHLGRHPVPAIQVPPWPVHEDPISDFHYSVPVSGVSGGGEPLSPYLLTALQRFLPSNDLDDPDELDAPIDAYSCDEFRMYEFKVRRCARGRSHDWTECPYAHPGEKARRRDPRKYHYSGAACPEFRKGSCRKGDSCEFAHGVFECWLHPARYRTQPCKDGVNCRRRVCFFAHTPEQLRVLPPQSSPKTSSGCDSYDGSPMRQQQLMMNPVMSSMSPTSTLVSPPMSPPSESPPLSPIRRGSASSSVNEVLASLRQLQLSKAKSAPSSWGLQQLGSSPRGVVVFGRMPGYGSVPNTPPKPVVGGGSLFGGWEEAVAERVESGRDLRAMMAEKLSMENSLEGSTDGAASTAAAPAAAPDVGWVSDLLN